MAASSPDAPSSPDDESHVRPSSPGGRDTGRLSMDRVSRGVSIPPPIATIGRYDVLGRIAVGGMAEIYLAQERSSGGSSRLVVLKILREHVEDETDLDKMFLREGSVAMQLSHPNICSTYEFGKVGGHFFIAMEFVDGATIRQMLMALAKRRQAMPVSFAVAIFARVAAALDYAHRAKDSRRRRMGVVHRDVTPHNIMVRADGVVKLLDFGVVHVAGERDSDSGGVKGKWGYLSPEQTVSGSVDGRSDVFALGICLYEVLTMKRLYKRDGQVETFKAILRDPVPSIRDIDPSFPEAIDAIVQKALAKKPSERFQTAGAMQQALEEWLADQRQVVNASRLSELMRTLYGEELEQGPALVSDESVIRRLALFDESEESAEAPAPGAAPSSAPAPSAAPPPSEVPPSAAPPATNAPLARPRRQLMIGAAGAFCVIALGIGVGAMLRDSPSDADKVLEAPPTDAPARTAEPEESQTSAEAETPEEQSAEAETPEEQGAEGETPEEQSAEGETPEEQGAGGEAESPEADESAAAEPEGRSRRRRRRGRMRPRFVDDPGF
jgi:serine/threonine protein kinase